MDTFEFAIQMERDGEKYYRDAAAACDDAAVAGVLNLLADQEVDHVQVLQVLSESQAADGEPVSIAAGVKNVFVEMKESGKVPDVGGAASEAYRKAQELETKSKDFYEEQAGKADSEEVKRVFLKLANEELRHYQVLESILELVSKPDDGQWLENAEWYHSDDF